MEEISKTKTREQVLTAIKEQGYQFLFYRDVPSELSTDPGIALAVIERGQIKVKDLPAELLMNRDVMLAMACRVWDGSGLESLPWKWRDDEAFVREVLAVQPGSYRHASERLQGFREFALLAVRSTRSNALENVPEPLRHDREVLIAALQGHHQAFLHVPEELRSDVEFLELAVAHSNGDPIVFNAMPVSARDDRPIALRMVSRSGWAFRKASERLRDDKELLLAAMAQDVRAVETASTRLRADLEVARVVANSKDCGSALRFLDASVRNAAEIVPVAVAHGASLEYFDAHWCDDETTVRAAVSRWGRNYQFASPRLQAIREIALLAAQDHTRNITWGFDLAEVPEGLRSDREIVLNAVKCNAKNAGAVTASLMADLDFVRELVATGDDVLQHLPAAQQREVAFSSIRTQKHHGRRLVVETIPESGYVYNHQRTLERIRVIDEHGGSLAVEAVPVITYVDAGPMGSYLAACYLNNVVLCGAYAFIVERYVGFSASEDERKCNYVLLIPWTVRDGDVRESYESLRARALLIYAGRELRAPGGVCVFASEDEYAEAMSILGGAQRERSRFSPMGPNTLEVRSEEVGEVEGAARVYVDGCGWRWLLPHSEGPRAALEWLRATTDDDDRRWLLAHLGAASESGRALVAQHFHDSPSVPK